MIQNSFEDDRLILSLGNAAGAEKATFSGLLGVSTPTRSIFIDPHEAVDSFRQTTEQALARVV